MPKPPRALAIAALSPFLALASCGGRVIGADTSGEGGSGAVSFAAGGGDGSGGGGGSTSVGGYSSGGRRATGGRGASGGGTSTGGRGAAGGGTSAGGRGAAGGGTSVGGAVPTQQCKPNETYCSNFGLCLDLSTNFFACGSCTTACPNAEACIGGQCAYGQCIPGMTWCTSDNGYAQCEDLQTSTADCGACGNACGPSESCTNGKCVPPDCSNITYCPGVGCVDTTSDITACGSCGNSCSGSSIFWYDSYACLSGKCTCPPGAIPCAGGCATQFWYCPKGSTPPLDQCKSAARTPKEACACGSCLSQVEDCATDLGCINAMDCALSQTCSGCAVVSCTDQDGNTNPLATSLANCMDTSCGGFY